MSSPGMAYSLSDQKRERVTWRLDPANYDYVDQERRRWRLRSMNAALNRILEERRQMTFRFASEYLKSDSTLEK